MGSVVEEINKLSVSLGPPFVWIDSALKIIFTKLENRYIVYFVHNGPYGSISAMQLMLVKEEKKTLRNQVPFTTTNTLNRTGINLKSMLPLLRQKKSFFHSFLQGLTYFRLFLFQWSLLIMAGKDVFNSFFSSILFYSIILPLIANALHWAGCCTPPTVLNVENLLRFCVNYGPFTKRLLLFF